MYGMFLLCEGEDVFPLLAPTVKCWHLSSWWIFSFKGSDSQEFKVGICPVHPLKKALFFIFFIIGLVHTLAKNRSVGERGVPCIKYTSGTLHYILLPAGDSRSGQCWVYTGMKENKNIFSFIWNVFFSFLWVWTFTTFIIIIIIIIVVVVVVVVVVVDNA